MDEPADIYSLASHLARANNQIVGEKSDFYITLEQLEAIIKKVFQISP